MATITELEDRLKADNHGQYKHELEALLELHILALSTRLKQGCEPDIYQRSQVQLDACLASKRVISTLWQRYHKASEQLFTAKS
ncbi:EscE/YscE/SsaE family type III secretion system needle protein co-chaperone [Vibrio marisflavi]|uniref:Uncharacterized protein n=1 Tax=Vibrio marisflavi CECT 7928 TaxID=634439 RepID=A0ABM8ZYE8_9VIBR|nr:EscE/YscE/SsaE family type III secretion system needle protein co-chaperone [Vibrio marisflavi]CAH0535953.1 hypothetical protein VMF7928_00068 [Vibrio marisflavi CECT 7928]